MIRRENRDWSGYEERRGILGIFLLCLCIFLFCLCIFLICLCIFLIWICILMMGEWGWGGRCENCTSGWNFFPLAWLAQDCSWNCIVSQPTTTSSASSLSSASSSGLFLYLYPTMQCNAMHHLYHWFWNYDLWNRNEWAAPIFVLCFL